MVNPDETPKCESGNRAQWYSRYPVGLVPIVVNFVFSQIGNVVFYLDTFLTDMDNRGWRPIASTIFKYTWQIGLVLIPLSFVYWLVMAHVFRAKSHDWCIPLASIVTQAIMFFTNFPPRDG